jgi:hypothetical protein
MCSLPETKKRRESVLCDRAYFYLLVCWCVAACLAQSIQQTLHRLRSVMAQPVGSFRLRSPSLALLLTAAVAIATAVLVTGAIANGAESFGPLPNPVTVPDFAIAGPTADAAIAADAPATTVTTDTTVITSTYDPAVATATNTSESFDRSSGSSAVGDSYPTFAELHEHWRNQGGYPENIRVTLAVNLSNADVRAAAKAANLDGHSFAVVENPDPKQGLTTGVHIAIGQPGGGLSLESEVLKRQARVTKSEPKPAITFASTSTRVPGGTKICDENGCRFVPDTLPGPSDTTPAPMAAFTPSASEALITAPDARYVKDYAQYAELYRTYLTNFQANVAAANRARPIQVVSYAQPIYESYGGSPCGPGGCGGGPSMSYGGGGCSGGGCGSSMGGGGGFFRGFLGGCSGGGCSGGGCR